MEIFLAKNAGFCPGVKRADEAVHSLIEKQDGTIYTLGKLIHNEEYVKKLRDSGVEEITISKIEEILPSAQRNVNVVIRTHGITKEEGERLKRLEDQYPVLKVYDMTCPSVKRIHRLAETKTDEVKTVFLLFCNPAHPEAKGIMSYAKGEKYAFSSLDTIKDINFREKVPILCSQTTQNLLEFEKIKKFFKKLYTNLIFFDTICSVTEKRQHEAIELSEKTDAMIVIGGSDSSNTRKLYELCSAKAPCTLWIEGTTDINDHALPKGAKKIGITAGASTPEDIILEVIKQWKKN